MAEINLYLDLIDLSEIKDFCLEHGEERVCARGDLFLSEDEVSVEFGYVDSGYFKYVVQTSDGVEKGVGFSFAGDFIGDINHSLMRIPGGVSIVAGCDARMHMVPMAAFLDFAAGKGLRFCMSIEVCLFHTFYTRYIDLHRLSPKERYLKVLREYPALLQRMPLCEIASYIGVTPVHLSRIRRQLHMR